jgi:ATP-binding cassette subfamily B protein
MVTFVKHDVPPHHGTLPTTFPAYLKYIWKKNPVLWPLFFLQDAIHFTRYPIAFILFGMIIDSIRMVEAGTGIPLETQHLLMGLIAVLTFGELAHIWTAHIIIHWKPKLRAAVRSDFLGYTMGHSHSYFQDNFAGAIARKVSEVAESSLRLHDIIRFQIFFALIQLFINTAYMFAVDWVFGVGLILFMLGITLPLFIRMPIIRKRALRFSDERAHVTGVLVDMLSNIPAVKFFSGLTHETSVHGSAAAEERKRDSKLIRTMIQIEDIRRLCLILLGGGMTTLAILAWSEGIITVGEASTISSLSLMMAGTAWMLGGGIVQFVNEAGYISDALRITSAPHGIVDKSDAKPLATKEAAIDFNHVDFTFGRHPVFKDLDIHISAGEKIALVGPSGAGKSTFVALLMRLYELDTGNISIAGQDISNVTQDSLRDHIAVIPQDTALFHRSLMENIRYGRRGATDDEVINAAKKAFAHDFIESLPEGYSTLVGERGIRLSGGQRQRIAIARAILKNAPILILDEATSALDSESERLIQNALDDLMVGKTVIAIAHRLSTISRMDRIIVLDKGQIAEAGSHEALLAQRGLYAKLWAMQSGGFLLEEGLDLAAQTGEKITIKTIDG